MNETTNPLLQRLAQLVVKDGVALGLLAGEERELALALVWASLPEGLACDERAINGHLKAALAGPAACLQVDHVELRRWLVDGGWLSRDGYGREYRRVDAGALLAHRQVPAAAVAALDVAAWVGGRREAQRQRRQARRANWMAAQGLAT